MFLQEKAITVRTTILQYAYSTLVCTLYATPERLTLYVGVHISAYLVLPLWRPVYGMAKCVPCYFYAIALSFNV